MDFNITRTEFYSIAIHTALVLQILYCHKMPCSVQYVLLYCYIKKVVNVLFFRMLCNTVLCMKWSLPSDATTVLLHRCECVFILVLYMYFLYLSFFYLCNLFCIVFGPKIFLKCHRMHFFLEI